MYVPYIDTTQLIILGNSYKRQYFNIHNIDVDYTLKMKWLNKKLFLLKLKSVDSREDILGALLS